MGRGWINTHKTANAAKKGKLFTKMAREIAVAAKLGGPNPEANARLKMAVAAALKVSCPKDTIERAIKKGSGQGTDGAEIEELSYEGLGPHGVGLIVECQTDNRNRTVSEIRNIFRRHNGNLGESGSVMWMFDRVALVLGDKEKVADAEEDAIEAGASDVEKNDDGTYSFFGEAKDTDTIREALSGRGWDIKVAELSYRPKNKTDLTEEQLKEVDELITALDDNDDTSKIYSTIE
jgi:YebC/PmpR family DNA-binding regulatory protein